MQLFISTFFLPLILYITTYHIFIAVLAYSTYKVV